MCRIVQLRLVSTQNRIAPLASTIGMLQHTYRCIGKDEGNFFEFAPKSKVFCNWGPSTALITEPMSPYDRGSMFL